jgi:hypothetical protein
VQPAPPSVIEVVIDVTLRLDDLFRQGKNFKWERPTGCPKCQRKVYGHGFTPRYFQGFSSVFWLRRFRCTGCSSVLVLRPSGFWPRLQSSIEVIFQALQARLGMERRWSEGIPRQRGGHWLRGFLSRLRRHPEWLAGEGDLPGALTLARASGRRFV